MENIYIGDRVKAAQDGRTFEATVDFHPLADLCLIPDGGLPISLKKNSKVTLELLSEGPHHGSAKSLKQFFDEQS